jgi:hypothetical protein
MLIQRAYGINDFIDGTSYCFFQYVSVFSFLHNSILIIDTVLLISEGT